MKIFFSVAGSLSRIIASIVFLILLFEEGSSVFIDPTNTLIFVVILILIGNYLREDWK